VRLSSFHWDLQLNISFGERGEIAPITCVYTYTAWSGSRFRILASWLSHFHILLCFGLDTEVLSSFIHPLVQGYVWGPLKSLLSQKFSQGSNVFVIACWAWLSNDPQGSPCYRKVHVSSPTCWYAAEL
jgi:hypothetical protein